jgi:hypothetical protein
MHLFGHVPFVFRGARRKNGALVLRARSPDWGQNRRPFLISLVGLQSRSARKNH